VQVAAFEVGAPVGDTDIGAFVIILDCSGSMKDATAGGGSKFAAAQNAAGDLIESIPEGRQLAFIMYGHNAQQGCQAVDVSRPLARLDGAGKADLQRLISKLSLVGHTPIALSLERAGEEQRGSSGNCVPTVIQEWSGTGFIQLTRT
jgi:hypothetical protein